jgi:hypothetical protein
MELSKGAALYSHFPKEARGFSSMGLLRHRLIPFHDLGSSAFNHSTAPTAASQEWLWLRSRGLPQISKPVAEFRQEHGPVKTRPDFCCCRTTSGMWSQANNGRLAFCRRGLVWRSHRLFLQTLVD